MNSLVRLLPVVCACVVTQACATHPPSSPAAPAATASQSSPAATAGTSSATAPAKPARIVLEDKTLTNEEVSQLFAQGYKPVSRGGEVYYCRREQQTGSRFTSMSCKTAEQMKRITQDSKDMLSAKQKPSGCAANGAGC